MNCILFDDPKRVNLLPLCFTRPTAQLRVGILTIAEKWDLALPSQKQLSFLAPSYLQAKFPTIVLNDNLLIKGNLLPTIGTIEAVMSLKMDQALLNNDQLIAIRTGEALTSEFKEHGVVTLDALPDSIHRIQFNGDIDAVEFPWQLFGKNGEEIESDFLMITKGRESQALGSTSRALQPERIFIEEGAKLEFATLNPNGGYIYIGKGAQIMEGAIVRNSLALCEHSTIKMAAKIYGPTTIGPHSKIGGEVNNSIIQGFSNKGHDGFLGNSVLGEWCNLGADTNNSNLKNNYAEVKLWNYGQQRFAKTGLQFCGLIMGDHSKSGINTMFNTGTVVGVSANIFGPGFPRNFVPSFSWGGAQGFTTFAINKAIDVAQKMMERRSMSTDIITQEVGILKAVFDQTAQYRNY